MKCIHMKQPGWPHIYSTRYSDYYYLVSKPEEVMKIEPTTAPNVNTVNAIQDLPGFLWTIAKLLVVNMALQRFPTTKEINIDNSQGINLWTGYHGSNRAKVFCNQKT